MLIQPASGRSYSQVLALLKSNVDLDVTYVNVREQRKTKNRGILIRYHGLTDAEGDSRRSLRKPLEKTESYGT